ncbi:MAG: EamA family transporter [Sporolactobacillus sp.]
MAATFQQLEKEKNFRHALGVFFVLSGACLWGVSGNVAQYLFDVQHIRPGWMTSVRMIVAGILLLLFTASQDSTKVWRIWQDRSSRFPLLIFGFAGMIGAQYTYFEAVAAGNAATATLLQYLSPVLIMVYLSIRLRKWPTRKEFAAIFLALFGIFLIVTKGQPGELSIAPAALFWGLLSAAGGALYSTQPDNLLHKWGAGPVVGWGMLLGGSLIGVFYPPWHYSGNLSLAAFAGILFVIIFGTLVAFYLYLASLKYLQPIETSLLGCAEPLSAAIVSVIWIHVSFTVFDWIGACCIMVTVFILSTAGGRKK